MSSRAYNWIPDRPDHRDQMLRLPLEMLNDLTPIPLVLDQKISVPVKDQGELGSCTANGIAGVMEFDQLAQGEPHLPLSRLWIYYQERILEHSAQSDSGAAIRDGIKVIAKLGACAETDWPYDVHTFRGPPPMQCTPDARLHTAISYQRVPNHPESIEAVLASGFPIVFGFSVFSGFESAVVARTGTVQMPGAKESMLGGHCAFMHGYNRVLSRVTCQNSWGPDWGDHGHFTLPYAYIEHLASDLWVVQRISS